MLILVFLFEAEEDHEHEKNVSVNHVSIELFDKTIDFVAKQDSLLRQFSQIGWLNDHQHI